MGAHNNERLEFLGDGLLNTIIAIELFQRRPDAPEGELSRLRAWLVRGETLAEVGREIHLGSVVRLGEGERKSGGSRRGTILADALEAVIGAVYLDSGFQTTQELVVRLFAERLDDLPSRTALKDPKTRLQELLQAQQQPLPEYELIGAAGADHERRFTVACRIAGFDLSREATASSRRKAEQQAAESCLTELEGRAAK